MSLQSTLKVLRGKVKDFFVIDKSLSVEGACADAKATGDGIRAVRNSAVNRDGDTIPGKEFFFAGGYARLCGYDGDTTGLQLESMLAPKDYNNRTLLLVSATQDKNYLLRVVRTIDGATTYYPIFHAANKPSGSYTGNGSATERKIEIGGIGYGLLIVSQNYSAIVNYRGALYWNNNGGTVSVLPTDSVNFAQGILTIATNESAVNYSSGTYFYQVI